MQKAKDHLLEIAARQFKDITDPNTVLLLTEEEMQENINLMTSPEPGASLRTREEVAFQMACESLEAVVAMSHEREVVFYIRQQLARIDALRQR